MPNDYFNHSANVIASGIRALAAQVNNIATEIGTGLNKLPTEIQFKRGTTRFAVDTGVADAYIVTLPYTPTLIDGFELAFRATNTNTGTSTINANGTGAKEIVYFDLTSLTINTIVEDAILSVRYSAGLDKYIMQSQAGRVTVLSDAQSLGGVLPSGYVTKVGTPVADEFGVFTGDGTLESRDTLKWFNSGVDLRAVSRYTTITSAATTAPAFTINCGSLFNESVIQVNINSAGQGDCYGVFVSNTSPQGDCFNFVSTSGSGNDSTDFYGANSTANTRAQVVLLNQGVGSSIDIDDTGASTANAALSVNANNTSRTAAVAEIIQDHATSTADALTIRQDGTGTSLDVLHNGLSTAVSITQSKNATGLSIINTSGTATAAELFESTLSAAAVGGSAVRGNVPSGATGNALYAQHSGVDGYGLYVAGTNNARTNPVAYLIQDSATSNANALDIKCDGNGRSVDIVHNGATSTAVYIAASSLTSGHGLEIFCGNGAMTGHALRIQTNHTSQTGDSINIAHAGSGNGISSTVTRADGTAARFYSNTASRTQPLVEIVNDNAIGSGVALQINQDQSGDAVNISTTHADATAMRIRSNTSNRTQPLVEIINDNAAGSGVGLFIQSDQGLALEITAGDVNIATSLNVEAYSEDANQYTATTGTRDLDPGLATYFYPSADFGVQAVTFTFGTPAASGRVTSFTVELLGANDATVAWPASVNWTGGSEPTWTSGVDIVSFLTRDGGTTWLGFLGGQAFS